MAEDVEEAVKNIAGIGKDVWDVQPALKDYPWRRIKSFCGGGIAMTPHISGTSLDALERYADGVLLTFYFTANVTIAPRTYHGLNGDYQVIW